MVRASSSALYLLAGSFLALALALALAACTGSPDDTGPDGALDAVLDDRGELRPGALDAPDLRVSYSPATGLPTMVRARPGRWLAVDDPSAAPAARARRFLGSYGAVIGMGAAERAELPLVERATVTDRGGRSHVRLAQRHRGLPVLGGEIAVHLDATGVVAVTGTWIPASDVPVSPALAQARAQEAAVAAVAKASGLSAALLRPRGGELAVLRTGLLAGVDGESRLVRGVEVAGPDDLLEQAWVDAVTGAVLERYPLRHDERHRVVYSPRYEPSQPDLFAVRSEGQDPTLVPQVDNLYDFSGHTYDLFASGFGRDSFDGAGAIMRTVYLVDQNCPNAYWNGSTTNYCPGFDLDDIVAHEWGHAYTQYTHGLIYSYQSGALNESYSDIWGETVDLLNGVDGLGGDNNAEPGPAGVRWAIGEDFVTGSGEYELLFRDMWDPDRLGYPGKVTSENYECGSGDNGGVHTNSGVPNHAYALLVDGGTYEGVTVGALGFVKAAHIYFLAQTAYQGPATTFAEHADALDMACEDLIGASLPGFLGLGPDTISAWDCEQVAAAMLAVEMRTPPPCAYQPVLHQGAPDACPGGAASFAEDWSDGLDGWTSESAGLYPEWPGYAWAAVDALPGGRTGRAAFALNSKDGTCAPGGDHSGTYSITSPPITAPEGDGQLELRFDHFVETEAGYDGGNLLVSRNGGAFALVPASAYRWNGPRSSLEPAPPVGQNTNPKAGEPAWHGADQGSNQGSWGTTVVDLSQIVAPGDSYQLRFEFGIDGCNGVTGWYVGPVRVDDCPALPGPSLSLGADYEDPDIDGSYTLSWQRPDGAPGPDELQQSTVSCRPQLSEDAEAGLGQWIATTVGTGTSGWQAADDKPLHGSTALRALGVEGTGNAASILTLAQPIELPAGAIVTLRFDDWFVNELDDRGFVEVSSDGGASWTAVYTADRALIVAESDVAFASEPLEPRAVDLTGYAGQTILLRLRYQLGGSNYFAYKPIGWYVDDIVLQASRWDTLLASYATATTIGGRASGEYCYRVRTTHLVGETPVRSSWSELVSLLVARGDGAADTDGDTVVDPVDNCTATPNLDQQDTDRDGLGDACDPCPTKRKGKCKNR